MNQIEFTYLYRDGSNFKSWSRIVFANPQSFTPEVVMRFLRDAFGEEGFFLAHQVRIPEVFLYGASDANADDHCFHEFYGVAVSSQTPNDSHGRSIAEFVAEVQTAAKLGWVPFDPFDRWLRE